MKSWIKYAGAMTIAAALSGAVVLATTAAPDSPTPPATAICNNNLADLQASVLQLANKANEGPGVAVNPFRVAVNTALNKMDAVSATCSRSLTREQQNTLAEIRTRYTDAYEDTFLLGDLGAAYRTDFTEASSILDLTYSIKRK